MKKIRVIDFFHYLCKRYRSRSRRIDAWRVSFLEAFVLRRIAGGAWYCDII